MLEKCSECAAATGIVVSTSKCSNVKRKMGEFRQKSFRRQTTIYQGGFAEDMAVDSLRLARKPMRMISTLGLFRGCISTQMCINIFKTFVRTLWQYSMHLTTHTGRMRKEHTLVMQDAMQAILGRWLVSTSSAYQSHVAFSQKNISGRLQHEAYCIGWKERRRRVGTGKTL